MPKLLARLLEDPPGPAAPVPHDVAVEAGIPEKEFSVVPEDTFAVGRPSPLTCPECGGNLTEIDDGPLVRYRCKVGHAYSPESLAHAHKEAVEHALWVALRTHQDRVVLFDRLAEKARERSHDRVAANWSAAAAEARNTVALLRNVLNSQGDVLSGTLPVPPPEML